MFAPCSLGETVQGGQFPAVRIGDEDDRVEHVVGADGVGGRDVVDGALLACSSGADAVQHGAGILWGAGEHVQGVRRAGQVACGNNLGGVEPALVDAGPGCAGVGVGGVLKQGVGQANLGEVVFFAAAGSAGVFDSLDHRLLFGATCPCSGSLQSVSGVFQ
ncbi:Uncharacterised protein [Mycobacteroides abscessus subsp. abscessus]|nr:Uncharacterised protein [Mycobacteroides abscessus subsp. abscessus]